MHRLMICHIIDGDEREKLAYLLNEGFVGPVFISHMGNADYGCCPAVTLLLTLSSFFHIFLDHEVVLIAWAGT
jgi:hypothetical protein